MNTKLVVCHTVKLEAEGCFENIVMWFTGKFHDDGDPIFAHRSTGAKLYETREDAEAFIWACEKRYGATNPTVQTMFIAQVEV